jgi:hypothetical protein
LLKMTSRFVLEVLPYLLTALIATVVLPGFLYSVITAVAVPRFLATRVQGFEVMAIPAVFRRNEGAFELTRQDNAAFAPVKTAGDAGMPIR